MKFWMLFLISFIVVIKLDDYLLNVNAIRKIRLPKR
jgi:hypothetical protein